MVGALGSVLIGRLIPTAVFCRSMKTVPRPEWNVKTLLRMGEKGGKLRKTYAKACQGRMGGVWERITFLGVQWAV
jgi:hypothetical protein